MKLITVSGAYSNIGKTTVVNILMDVFRNKKVFSVKFGTGKNNPSKKQKLFTIIEEGLAFINEESEKGKLDLVVIESNGIFNHLNVDFSIFIKGNNNEWKKNARLAESHSDLILTEGFDLKKTRESLSSLADNFLTK